MSQQNPIHRDGGRRDEGEQPFRDNKEAFAEKEAELERESARQQEAETSLTEDERNAAQTDAAEQRFADIARDDEA